MVDGSRRLGLALGVNVGYDGASGLGSLLGVGGNRAGRSDDPGSVLDISHSLFFVFVVRSLAGEGEGRWDEE